MIRKGHQLGKAGLYLNIRSGEFVRHDGGLLPGNNNVRYIKIPPLLAIVLGPSLGGIYILIMPFIALAGAAYFLLMWCWKSISTIENALLALLIGPSWMPGRSYLVSLRTRRRKSQKADHPNANSEMDQLVREIEEKMKKERRG